MERQKKYRKEHKRHKGDGERYNMSNQKKERMEAKVLF